MRGISISRAFISHRRALLVNSDGQGSEGQGLCEKDTMLSLLYPNFIDEIIDTGSVVSICGRCRPCRILLSKTYCVRNSIWLLILIYKQIYWTKMFTG